MPFYMNIPFICIMLSMFTAIISSVLPKKMAKWGAVIISGVVFVLNATLVCILYPNGESFNYLMGHFPAPFGNEIRCGLLESVLAAALSLIMCLSIMGDMKKTVQQSSKRKQNLVYTMFDLVLASMLALIYTNDLFTGYVFIEILTLASCALIISRQNGRTFVSSMRYMIMSLLGSGLLLIAIAFTYNITGHLLIEYIHDSFRTLAATGEYHVPLTVIMGLFFVGLAIKCALFPFHTWLPDSYGYATPAASAVLSSVVSKAYIILLIKIYVRMIGQDLLVQNQALILLLVFGVISMIMGSVDALTSKDIRRMIAYSSVAQIGYIFAGVGTGLTIGIVAALYHLIMHSVAKSGIFIATSALTDASGDSKRFSDLHGAGYRDKTAGVLFTVSAFNMIGIPIFAGFISKMNYAEVAFTHGGVTMWVLIIALVLSTLLNVLYFMKTIISLYRAPRQDYVPPKPISSPLRKGIMWCFVAVNVAIAVFAVPLMQAITNGLAKFG